MRHLTSLTRCCLPGLLSLIMAAHADTLATLQQSGSGNSGVLSINQAAGDGNLQANLRNLAISTDTAHANTAAQQRLSASGSPHAGSDSAIIAADSLRNNVGLVGINQSAGQANQSANSLSLAIGGHSAYAGGAIAAQDSVLQSAATGPAVRNETSANSGQEQQTVISDSAFQGSRGVIQLNQIAGNLNQAVNALAIRVVRP